LFRTRKGLFTVSRKAKWWEITAAEFLGELSRSMSPANGSVTPSRQRH
jgi:hypothetical protein